MYSNVQISHNIKEALAKELEKPELEIDLLYATLLISQYLTQPFRFSVYLNLFDEMAASIQPAIQSADTDQDIINIFNNYLFNELKFSGNNTNYYHPGNSFLNNVLDLRTGIPLSLSIIYLEIGWRLGLPVVGIGLPGHFMVGYKRQTDTVYIDVFNQGKILTESDCMDLCHVPEADRLPFRKEYLKPALKSTMLLRLLVNLKQIYVTLETWQTAYKTVDLILVVKPNQSSELRDRGLIAYRLGYLQDAVFDIKQYLLITPNSPDSTWLKRHLEIMEARLLRLN